MACCTAFFCSSSLKLPAVVRQRSSNERLSVVFFLLGETLRGTERAIDFLSWAFFLLLSSLVSFEVSFSEILLS